MGSDVTLTIVDSRDGTVLLADRWLGENVVVARIREVVRKEPDAELRVGLESWSVRPEEFDELATSFIYAGGPSLEERAAWRAAYSADHFWWFVERDF